MKVLRSFSLSISLLLFFCIFGFAQPGFAQKDNRMNALPENATLEETQTWLIRIITGNSAYRVKETEPVKDVMKTDPDRTESSDRKISAVKFDGCQMSYTLQKNAQIAQSQTGSMRTTNQSLTTVGPDEQVKVLFDLKDINTEEVSLQEINETSPMSVINMRTQNYKRTIKIKGDKENGSLTVSVASLVVGTNIADQVKEGLLHAITLCQAAPSAPSAKP
jgi:hypothetical protein